MDTKKAVDKLSESLKDFFFYCLSHGAPYKIIQVRKWSRNKAEWLLNHGYIPKESALEFVEICSACEGSGTKFKAFQLHNICPNCDGSRIVMKKDR